MNPSQLGLGSVDQHSHTTTDQIWCSTGRRGALYPVYYRIQPGETILSLSPKQNAVDYQSNHTAQQTENQLGTRRSAPSRLPGCFVLTRLKDQSGITNSRAGFSGQKWKNTGFQYRTDQLYQRIPGRGLLSGFGHDDRSLLRDVQPRQTRHHVEIYNPVLERSVLAKVIGKYLQVNAAILVLVSSRSRLWPWGHYLPNSSSTVRHWRNKLILQHVCKNPKTTSWRPLDHPNDPSQPVSRRVFGEPYWLRLETFNPGPPSPEDRMAVKMIDDAEASGKLLPRAPSSECTSGNTGMGLALVACVRGYKCILMIKQSKKKSICSRRWVLKSSSAQQRRSTDPRSYYSRGRKAEQNQQFLLVQSIWQPIHGQAHYESTGPEIWDQTDGKITHLVVDCEVPAERFRVQQIPQGKNPAIRIWKIPLECFQKYPRKPVFWWKGSLPLHHRRIGGNILPKCLISPPLIFSRKSKLIKDAALAARRLAREGILLGYSAGSALAGLHQLKNQLNLKTPSCSSFMTTDPLCWKIYNDDWMRQRGFLESRLKVRDLVAAKKDKSFYSVSPDSRLRDVLTMIKDHDISQLPVMKDEEVIGTISENSILQCILEKSMKNADKAVSEIMSEPMPRVSMDLPLACSISAYRKIPGVITGDQSNQYHVLTKYDIIRAL